MQNPLGSKSEPLFRVSSYVLMQLKAMAYEMERPWMELRDFDCFKCGKAGLRAEAFLRLDNIEQQRDNFPVYGIVVRCVDCGLRVTTGQDIGAPYSLQAQTARARRAHERLRALRAG